MYQWNRIAQCGRLDKALSGVRRGSGPVRLRCPLQIPLAFRDLSSNFTKFHADSRSFMNFHDLFTVFQIAKSGGPLQPLTVKKKRSHSFCSG